MDNEYLEMSIKELRREVLVKGADIVSQEMEVSESCVRELCPNEAYRYDLYWENRVDELFENLDLDDPEGYQKD
mgnify:CR=1 FL=1